jgi:biopolymer transport protein ExbD
MNKRRRSNLSLPQRQLSNDCLMGFGIAYLVVVLVTFIIMAVVNPYTDLKYPRINNPASSPGHQIPLSQILKPSKAYSDKAALLIAANWSGNIYVDNKRINLYELRKLVIQHHRIGSGKVYIKADQTLTWGRVMEIIRICADSGAKEISLLIREYRRPVY